MLTLLVGSSLQLLRVAAAPGSPPTAACAAAADAWCRASACGQLIPAANLAAYSTADTGSTKAWRCYAPGDLDGPDPASTPLLQRERNSSAPGDYCSRSAEILAVLTKCDPHWKPPAPAPPSPPPFPPGPAFKLHTLESDPAARCLDGTPAAFYLGTPVLILNIHFLSSYFPECLCFFPGFLL